MRKIFLMGLLLAVASTPALAAREATGPEKRLYVSGGPFMDISYVLPKDWGVEPTARIGFALLSNKKLDSGVCTIETIIIDANDMRNSFPLTKLMPRDLLSQDEVNNRYDEQNIEVTASRPTQLGGYTGQRYVSQLSRDGFAPQEENAAMVRFTDKTPDGQIQPHQNYYYVLLACIGNNGNRAAFNRLLGNIAIKTQMKGVP